MPKFLKTMEMSLFSTSFFILQKKRWKKSSSSLRILTATYKINALLHFGLFIMTFNEAAFLLIKSSAVISFHTAEHA